MMMTSMVRSYSASIFRAHMVTEMKAFAGIIDWWRKQNKQYVVYILYSSIKDRQSVRKVS